MGRAIVQAEIWLGRTEMPRSEVLSFTDPFPCQSAVQGADVKLFPTAKGSFGAELTQISMNQLCLQRFHQQLPQVSIVTIKPGRQSIGFLGQQDQPALQHCGMDILPGEIIVNHFDVLHRRSAAGLHYASMSLTVDDFDTACNAINGHEFKALPLMYLVRPSPALMSRLMNLHEVVGKIAETNPNLLELPEVRRALEQQLIHTMVRCLSDGAPAQMTASGRRRDAIVARFEGFLEAHPDTPLYLTEICAAIAVSERTLRAVCEEHLGMGPIRYLSLRRMHLVRRALLRADTSTTTVTRVATDNGFWELGRFSVSYRTLFGESPSESLRRPAVDRPVVLNRPSSLGTPFRRSRSLALISN
jgi:AraC-like DNA-binding protein